MAEQAKPSFFRSVMSGIGGYFKGAMAGGIVGAIGGAALGAIGAAAIIATDPAAGLSGLFSLGGGSLMAAAATTGAAVGGVLLASIGSIAGTTTGVVRSRETEQPSAEAIANVAKVSFVQGMATEQSRAQQQEVTEAAGSKWQDAEKARIVARASAQATIG